MDQNLLLTVEKLSLNPDIQRGWVVNQTFVIKNVPAQTYLSVSAAQATVLQVFAVPSTVPDAFSRLLQGRECLPLREFYELVVKAHQAGVLCSGTVRKPLRKSINWPALKCGAVLWPALILELGALVGLGLSRSFYSADWLALCLGVVVTLVLFSVGQMLAAAFLVGVGGEVYAGKGFSAIAGLRVRFDLRDSCLVRPVEQALIVVAGNLPLTVGLLFALFKLPTMAAPLAVGWLLAWRPWGESLPRKLGRLLSRNPALDTDSNFLFLPNQRPQLHWRPWWQLWDWRVCLFEMIWAVLWSVLVARLILHELGLSFSDVRADRAYWSMSLSILASALLITLMVIMVRRWRHGLRQIERGVRRRGIKLWRQWRHEYVFPDNEAGLLRIASAHPLIGLLNPYDQSQIIREWRPVTLKAWTTLSSDEIESGEVGLILSGSANASRVGTGGRRRTTMVLEEGDFFGMPQLKQDSGDGLLQVRSRAPVHAMMLPMTVFKSLVIARLGIDTVYDLTHKYAFLRMLSLCEFWSPHAIARFARLAQVTNYADGEYVVNEKSETRWFYIIYDGIAQVRSRGKLLTRLRAGDFFGEISLLQNSVAVADVVAQGRLRCLQIDRNSFLRFMTHNHHVALRLERISSYRLNRPIFPLEPALT